MNVGRVAAGGVLVVAGVLGVLTACGGDDPGPAMPTGSAAAEGRQVAESLGCTSCHSTNGDRKQGPTWKGLAGAEVTLTDGSTVVADATYLARSITDPDAEVVEDFIPIMPDLDVTDDQVEALVAYIQELE